jgi:hypothetical protein
MPITRRPSDSTSIVDSILAASTAGRCGTTRTASTNRIRDVLAAMNEVAVSSSCRSVGALAMNSPDSEYG